MLLTAQAPANTAHGARRSLFTQQRREEEHLHAAMGEGLKLRKRQVEKSKEKLQSLEFVPLPQELKNGMVRIKEEGGY